MHLELSLVILTLTLIPTFEQILLANASKQFNHSATVTYSIKKEIWV